MLDPCSGVSHPLMCVCPCMERNLILGPQSVTCGASSAISASGQEVCVNIGDQNYIRWFWDLLVSRGYWVAPPAREEGSFKEIASSGLIGVKVVLTRKPAPERRVLLPSGPAPLVSGTRYGGNSLHCSVSERLHH